MTTGSEVSIGVVIGGRVRLHRDALADALGRTNDMRVLAAGRTRDEVRSAVERLQPDVVVVDLDNRSGLDVVGELVARGAPVVGVLSSDEDEDLVALGGAGARRVRPARGFRRRPDRGGPRCSTGRCPLLPANGGRAPPAHREAGG